MFRSERFTDPHTAQDAANHWLFCFVFLWKKKLGKLSWWRNLLLKPTPAFNLLHIASPASTFTWFTSHHIIYGGPLSLMDRVLRQGQYIVQQVAPLIPLSRHSSCGVCYCRYFGPYSNNWIYLNLWFAAELLLSNYVVIEATSYSNVYNVAIPNQKSMLRDLTPDRLPL